MPSKEAYKEAAAAVASGTATAAQRAMNNTMAKQASPVGTGQDSAARAANATAAKR